MEGRHICIDGNIFFKGYATTVQNNCLIDSLRQTLALVANEHWVRGRLQLQFPQGPEVVTASNFLTLEYHWCAVIDTLFIADQSGKPKLSSHTFKVVCVDLTYLGNGDVVGSGPKTLYIARENGCHFAPLFRQQFYSGTAQGSRGVGTKVSQPSASADKLGESRPSIGKPLPAPEAAVGGSSQSLPLPRSTAPLSTWTVSDVAAWARTTLGAPFAERVLANDIDGTLLLGLTEKELVED